MDFLTDPAGAVRAAWAHRRWMANQASLLLHPFPWRLRAAEPQLGTADQDLVSKDTLLVQQPSWDMRRQFPLDTQGTPSSVAAVSADAFACLAASAAVDEAGYAETVKGDAAGYGEGEGRVSAEDASGLHTEACRRGAERRTWATAEAAAAVDPTSAAAAKRSQTEASVPHRQKRETGWTSDAACWAGFLEAFPGWETARWRWTDASAGSRLPDGPSLVSGLA